MAADNKSKDEDSLELEEATEEPSEEAPRLSPDDEPTDEVARPQESINRAAPTAKRVSKPVPAMREIEVEAPQADEATDSEIRDKKIRMAELNDRYSDKSPVPIVLSQEALKVEAAPASAGNPKYSQAAVKHEAKASWTKTAAKFVAVLSVLGGAGAVVSQQFGSKISGYIGKADPKSAAHAAPNAQTAGFQWNADAAGGAEKPAKEVKEESGVEKALLARCATDPGFCQTTAEAYANDGSFESAFTFFKAACDGGAGSACAGAANQYLEGKGVEKSYANAAVYYSKACDASIGPACANLAYLYSKGIAGGADASLKAHEAYVKACHLDVAKACTELGLAFSQGKGLERSPARAKEYLSKACRLNQEVACDEMKKYLTGDPRQ